MLKTIPHFSIGKTTLNNPIWCFKIGDNPNKKIIFQASIHAREYLTTLMMFEQINYLRNFETDATFYFIPLVNVDGVKLVLDGPNAFKTPNFDFISKITNNNYKLFKANIKGVDLNTNFDAAFGEGKSNVNYVNYQNYIGKYACSECETKALVDFTKKINPDMTISYHLKGEIVYYGFIGQSPQNDFRDRCMAKIIAKHLRYKPVFSKNSTGGYKDFCSVHYGIPSFTIEVGNDKFGHPFPEKELQTIVCQNRHLPLVVAKLLE